MRNFVIVGTQRTGSSALAESFNVCPQIACGWEWTQRVPWRAKLRAAELALQGDFTSLLDNENNHMLRICNHDTGWIGYRRLFRSSNKWLLHPRLAPALWADRLEDHLRWFARYPALHVFHIVRRDNIDWLKSKFISKESNIYWGGHYPKGTKIVLPVREAIKRIKSKEWVDSRLCTIQQTNPYLLVFYEDFLRDEKQVVSELLRFLRCEPSSNLEVSRQLQRQSDTHPSTYIQNYSQLKEALDARGLLTSEINQ